MVVIGAGVLWTRTKRLPALLQLIMGGIDFFLLAAKQVALYLRAAGKTDFYDFTCDPNVEEASGITLMISVAVFPILYLWYALGEKASNDAIQRTADGSTINS